MQRTTRWLFRSAIVLVAVALIAVGGGVLTLRASLPRDDGVVAAAPTRLSAPVTVDRDDRSIPTLRGASLEDVAYAQGFVHAQERFFQMDATRRYAAGRLCELFGVTTLRQDTEMRRFGYEAAAIRQAESLPEPHRRLLERYCAGVNRGLDDLDARPPEYLLLRKEVRPWRIEDSLLIHTLFFTMLSTGQMYELPLAIMSEALPPELVAFLTPESTRLDAPLLGEAVGPIPIPGPDVVDLRLKDVVPNPHHHIIQVFGETAASNNWAATASRTTHGHAMLAGDPHLSITVPSVWFRTEFEWTDDGKTRRAAGASVPGLPGIAIGTTDVVAWSMTNFFGDHEDLVIIEVDPENEGLYLTPDGPEPFVVRSEELIPAARPVRCRSTRWGPIVASDAHGRPLALHSTALVEGMMNLAIFDILEADSLEEALDAGARWRGPSQNMVVAAADGRIGWVVTGCFPKRRGFDGKISRSWADGTFGWDGILDERHRPRLIVEDGVLFSANGRMIGVEEAKSLTHHWASSERQHRIHELLEAKEKFSEEDFRAIQLDTRCAALDFVRDVFVETVAEDETDEHLATCRALVADWNGTADADQAALPVLLQLQNDLRERILAPLLAPLYGPPNANYNWPNVDEPMRRLLEERPAHFVPRNFGSWSVFLRDIVEQSLTPRPGALPLGTTWGEANRLTTGHPMAIAGVPWLSSRLQAPAHEQPGTSQTVRASSRFYGASLRMVASPNRLDAATFHMPIGQSGHFLSPHFMSGHESWRTGAAEPLRAGPPVSSFTIE